MESGSVQLGSSHAHILLYPTASQPLQNTKLFKYSAMHECIDVSVKSFTMLPPARPFFNSKSIFFLYLLTFFTESLHESFAFLFVLTVYKAGQIIIPRAMPYKSRRIRGNILTTNCFPYF